MAVIAIMSVLTGMLGTGAARFLPPRCVFGYSSVEVVRFQGTPGRPICLAVRQGTDSSGTGRPRAGD
jgi:hypothetical protein